MTMVDHHDAVGSVVLTGEALPDRCNAFGRPCNIAVYGGSGSGINGRQALARSDCGEAMDSVANSTLCILRTLGVCGTIAWVLGES